MSMSLIHINILFKVTVQIFKRKLQNFPTDTEYKTFTNTYEQNELKFWLIVVNSFESDR